MLKLHVYLSNGRSEEFEIASWGDVNVMSSSDEYKFLKAKDGVVNGEIVIPKINVDYFYTTSVETEE